MIAMRWPRDGHAHDAQAWIPAGHPSASLLYLYDGQTSALLDETFGTWSEDSVGYGSHALIFGPQVMTSAECIIRAHARTSLH